MKELSKKYTETFLIRIPDLKTEHCLDVNLVGLYLEKRLSLGESRRVEDHIQGCLFCLNQLNELQEMLHFEKTAESLIPQQQEKFSSLFPKIIKKGPEPRESTTQTVPGWLQQILQKCSYSFSSWNFSWKMAMAMVLITITSIYFTFMMVHSRQELKTVQLPKSLSQEIERSGVKVTLLDDSGKRIRETEGFVVNSNGLILANLNEITQAHAAQVTLQDGHSYPVDGVQPDEARNLAYLKINRNDLVPLKGSQSTELNIGEQIIQIENPLNPSGTSSYVTVTNLIASSRKSSTGQQYVQLVNQISSEKKGILVNQAGEAIGIIISRQDNISYAALFKPEEIKNISQSFKPISSVGSKIPNMGEAFSYYFKGIMAYDAMDYDKSINYLRKAVELNPNLDGARVTLGTLYNYQRKFDLEIHEYEEALKVNPKNTDAYYYLARAKDQAGLYDEAIHEFEKANLIDPTDKDILYELGIDYVVRGNLAKAREKYDALKKIDVGNANKLLKLIRSSND